MNEEKLIWGASYIDDDLVCEAIDYKPRRIQLAPWACAAAAAVVMVTAFAVFARQIGNSPVLPPDSGDSTYSEDISSASPTESQAVDIGNGMTLTGTPLDNSELEEFSIEPYIGSDYLTAVDIEFLDSLEIPELEDLYKSAHRLTWFSLCPCDVNHTSAVSANDRKVPYIERKKDDDSWTIRYCETGYTYQSFYNEYLRAFTKETIDEMFTEYDVFLNYNGELFCSDGARGGWFGEVHREYELISKSDTVIEFRRLTFHSDSDDVPATEYIPEYRDKYGLGVTEFKFVLTEDGWRSASVPKEISQTSFLTGTPLDNSELEEFSIEPYIGGEYLDADEEFLDGLGNPELKDLYGRAGRLFACLSESPPKPTFATTGNERKPAYIITADGRRYEEWGYTYESFYNAFLSAFTKEAAEEIFKEYNFCMNYNGALYFVNFAAGGNVWDGNIDEVHREYKLISKSDTVIKFRRISFSCDRDFKPAMEYIPELRDEYIVTYTDFEFVLTDDGWRAASIPEEKEDAAVPTTPIVDDQQAYAAIFKEFYPENQNPTMYGPPMTCEEIMNGLKPNPDYPEHDVDSYYLVEVIRALTSEEYMRMNGWDWSENDNKTIYEVKLIEDLISGEKTDRGV